MDQTSHPLSFAEYHGRVLRKVAREARGFWGIVVPFVIAVVIAILQGRFGLIKTDQTWSSAFVNAGPYATLLVGFLVFHFARAPWKLDQERYLEIQRRETEADSLRKRVSKLEAQIEGFRPRLRLTGYGTSFKFGGFSLTVHNVVIHNENTDVQNVAKQISALIRYRASVGEEAFKVAGRWFPPNDNSSFDATANIPSGQFMHLAYLVEDSGDFFTLPLFANSFGAGEKLVPGLWELHVTLTGANCDRVELETKVRLTNDGRLALEPWIKLPIVETPHTEPQSP